ncbi:MAG: ribonuclease HII [Bacteroidales bacterium]|nr:ribonuclease HII [Bacteroidales bacterium]MDD3273865.1 ribonuclease HII [Bacteroidales bacterium]MDD4058512.1 ribonuclease HII [Bacteroidales bacterium]
MLLPYHREGVAEAGCDEAGRGALAGPVYAAAVILPPDFFHPLLNDSKQLKESNRDKLRLIIEAEALDWAVAWASPIEIDSINILKASILSMHRALDKLILRPQSLIIDGNKFTPYKEIEHTCFVKGDGRYASIAAASVLAKTHRDEYMREIDKEFPDYNWKRNMAYPTAEHREAIKKCGICKYHRVSFANGVSSKRK